MTAFPFRSRTAWLLLGAVLVVKLVVLAQLHDHPLLHPAAGLDTTAYANLALRVVNGDFLLGPGPYYVSPLYIYFLAGALTLFDSFVAARVLQVVLGTATAGCIFFMAHAWFGSRAAWIALGLAATTGLLTFYEVLILQASLDGFLTASALTALTVGLIRGTRPRLALVASGVIFGLSVLNRPNMLFGAFAVILAAALVRRWRVAAPIALGLIAGLSPGVIRNLAVTGEASFVSSHGGLNFYIGNHAEATGFYRAVPGIRPLIEGQEEDARRVASDALGRPASDNEASAYFRDRALTWMTAHPAQALTLFAKKVYFTFHAQHIALPHSYPFYAYDTGSILRFLVAGPWLLVPLGLTGLLFRNAPVSEDPPDRRAFLVWASFVPGYAVGVAIFFVAERYRLPLFVPLIVASGGAVELAIRHWRAARLGAIALPALVALVLAIAVNWPMPSLDDGRWEEGLRTAQRLVITRDLADAERWVERLERSTKVPGRAHHGVGMQLVAEGNDAAALLHLRRSLELGFRPTEDSELWLRLGRLAARDGGPASAELFFRHAAVSSPTSAAARQQYGLNLLVLGRYPDAIRELQDAARLDPEDVESLAHLAYAEIKTGQVEAARGHLRAALARDPGHALSRQLAAAFRGGL